MEIVNKDIITMAIQNGNMFIGKGNSDSLSLEDTVQLMPAMTQQGPTYVGILAGKVMFGSSENLISIIVDKKSPFYTQYYEVISDIKIT